MALSVNSDSSVRCGIEQTSESNESCGPLDPGDHINIQKNRKNRKSLSRERRSPEIAKKKRKGDSYCPKEIQNEHMDLKCTSISPCRNVNDHYKRLNKISEGSYGAVYRAMCLKTGKILALKYVKFVEMLFVEGFPMAALREITILTGLKNKNIVNVSEVLVGDTPNTVYMVMEYVEHELKVLLQSRKLVFTISEKKELLYQLLCAIEYIHSQWVIHRDLKSSNLLYSNSGMLKLCDFGMARKFGEPTRPYTKDVVTQWYRAPEILLGENMYSTGVDMWSAGCIFAEIVNETPLFPVTTELEALKAILNLCGTPKDGKSWGAIKRLPRMNKFGLSITPCPSTWRQVFPECGPEEKTLTDCGLNLLQKMLDLNPKTRISASDALKHPYFSEKPVARGSKWMPSLPETNANNRQTRHTESSLMSQEISKRAEYRNDQISSRSKL
eukprot:GHVP01024979.1.p1 GENE.GHVP01024979.1~~GHVP01024979.1.p1  ORF type:complete len:442 (+),score=78.11 GHVP01024979.1:26-1351(+)